MAQTAIGSGSFSTVTRPRSHLCRFCSREVWDFEPGRLGICLRMSFQALKAMRLRGVADGTHQTSTSKGQLVGIWDGNNLDH